MNPTVTLSKNRLVKYLKKLPEDFTRQDIIDFIVNNDIEMVNFMYPAGDGRLKTLNFVVNNLDYLQTILTTGERVDGSSLFSFVEAGASDLYVIPRYSTAFVDPFAETPTLAMLCSFFDRNGNPLAAAPEQVLNRAYQSFKSATGLDFHAMGELEYYVIGDAVDCFPARDQRGYHESAPFAKFNDFRVKCMNYIARAGGEIKYGHSEVGNFSLNGKIYEQNEIEFLPVDARKAADQIMIAKWIIRNLAMTEGLDVTFAPKITSGKAGSGLHVHMKLLREGKNIMLNEDFTLSNDARKLIAGLMTMAPSLTAFGNTNPTSYFRLVPHQEAPTNICWGDANRSVLVRVPLGWATDKDMSAIANMNEKPSVTKGSDKQTIEIRSGDCSANIYLYLAAIIVAARTGFEMEEDALKLAEQTYVDVNIHAKENAAKLALLKQLPVNCGESADKLEQQRAIYEAEGVFSPALIDSTVCSLKAFNDAELIERAKADSALMLHLVKTYFHA